MTVITSPAKVTATASHWSFVSRSRTVSYTHLDVYKRQGAECSESSLDAQIGQDAARQRHQGEYRHQLCLTPAGELQVVVQGGHLEEPLAVGLSLIHI